MKFLVAGRFHAAAMLGLVILLTTAVYWPGLDGGFVFDDIPNIVDNTALHVASTSWADWSAAIFSSPASTLQRPLAMLTFAINHYFTALDPWAMKLTNLVIHLFNTALVFFLVRRLVSLSPVEASSKGSTDWASIAVAAAWALHPINLMAVLFIVQRMESLCHTAVFLGLILYLMGRERQLAGTGNGWWLILAGIIGGTAVGVLIKESAALLPLYAVGIELCLLNFAAAGQPDRRRLQWLFAGTLALPAVLATIMLVPRVLSASWYGSRNFTVLERLLTETRVLVDYIQWTVVPRISQMGLHHDDYPISHSLIDPVSTLVSVVALLILACLAWLFRARRPLAALGILWFFCAHLLTATIIPLELVFEHRNYFASLGLCLVLIDLLMLSPLTNQARKLGALLAASLVVLYAASTFLRASEWDHPVRFVSTEVAKHPSSPRATYELARILVVLSNYETGSPYAGPAMTAIEQARQAPGSSVLPAQAALIFAARTGQPLKDVWWRDLTQKLRSQPLGPQALGVLGSMSDCSSRRLCKFPPGEMLKVFSAALSHGDNPELLNIYGSYALNSLGDVELALKLWREAVKLRPSEPQYRINLSGLLIVLGKHQEAVDEIRALRQVGRLGQYESQARLLDAKLAKADVQAAGETPP